MTSQNLPPTVSVSSRAASARDTSWRCASFTPVGIVPIPDRLKIPVSIAVTHLPRAAVRVFVGGTLALLISLGIGQLTGNAL